MELYKKYRPKDINELHGQEGVVKLLKKYNNRKTIPHFILLVGPSGCGKTTVARILSSKLECGKADFFEINSADFRGIDMVRDIRDKMSYSPMHGASKVYLIDEAHQLTTAAQDALLKMLEDTPAHVWFFLATTDPGKLKKTIQTRATVLTMKALSPEDMKQLIEDTIEKEGKKALKEEVVESLIEASQGSPRMALVLLNSVLQMENTKEQLAIIQQPDTEATAIQLARLLMNPRPSWGKVSSVLKEITEDPETLRHFILSYACSCLLGKNKAICEQASLIIEEFRDNFYDSKKAGLAQACYRVVHP